MIDKNFHPLKRFNQDMMGSCYNVVLRLLGYYIAILALSLLVFADTLSLMLLLNSLIGLLLVFLVNQIISIFYTLTDKD